jgi:hypothetical protein
MILSISGSFELGESCEIHPMDSPSTFMFS